MFQSKIFYDPENLMDIFDNVYKPQCTVHSIKNAKFRRFNNTGNQRIIWPLTPDEADTDWVKQPCLGIPITSSITSPSPSPSQCGPSQAREISEACQGTGTVGKSMNIFAIDCVLKEMFACLDLESLLNCRHVSRLWSYLASKQLQKMVTIEFVGKCPPFRYALVKKNKTLKALLRPDEGLENLIPLMHKSSSFPCTSFKFHSPNLIAKLGQIFFREFGQRMRKLELTGGKRNAPIYFVNLKNILCDLAPNLEHFILDTDVGPDAIVSLYDSDSDIQNSSPKCLNLKVLEFKRKIESALFQGLLEFSPKLVEIKIEEIQDLALLTQPVDCFHFLKSLKLCTNNFYEILLEIKVRSWASVKKVYFDSSNFQKIRKVLQQMVIAITLTILNGVAPYVEKVVWGDVSILEEAVNFLGHVRHFGEIFPSMPNVAEMVLSLRVYKTFFGNHATTKRFYPPEINLQSKFPNLKTVHLFNHTAPRDSRVPIMLSHSDVVTSVTRVIVYGMSGMGIFSEMFPNAKIVFTEPGKFRNSYWDVINF